MALLIAVITLPGNAHGARVSGRLTAYESTAPIASRDLHFENTITRDIYLAPTHSDGSFSQDLPPGVYNLRGERGATLVHAVKVADTDVTLGNVSELAPFAPARLFQLQNIAHSIVTSPAPSTAFIMTVDPTVLSPSAQAVPKPVVDWSKLPPGSEAVGPSSANAPPAAAPQPNR